MDIILLEKVEKLGNVGEIVSVKNGFARNYLIPQNKALRATAANKVEFEARKADLVKENDAKRKEAEKAAKGIDGKVLTVIRQAGDDGRLYGSVKARDIAKAAEDEKLAIEARTINLSDPIKYVGSYDIKVRLHPEVVVDVKVNIGRTEEEANDILKEALAPKKEEKQEEAATETAEAAAEEAEAPAAEEKPKKKAAAKEEAAEEKAESADASDEEPAAE